jgi:glycerophosphoryl diester phosphodiesterase
MSFPEKIYTVQEVKTAKKLIDQGYKHELTVKGTEEFKQKISRILELVKTTGYYDFLRTYIRQIIEIDGLTQLRETEAAIWANKFAVENPVDAASLFIQKTYHMKQYLDGEIYYGGSSEKLTVEKRIDFLEELKNKTAEKTVKDECERLLKMWEESSLAP